MNKNKNKIIPVENLINDLRSSRSDYQVKIHAHHNNEPNKQGRTNSGKELQSGKVSIRKTKRNTSAGKSRKQTTNVRIDIKRITEVSFSEYGATDLRVRRNRSNDFKSHVYNRNLKNDFSKNFSSSSRLNLPVNDGAGHSRYYLDCGSTYMYNTNNSTSHHYGHGKSLSQSSSHTSNGNGSRWNEFNSQKCSTHPNLTSREKKPATTTSASGFSNDEDETLELEPKNENVTSSMDLSNSDNPFGETPTPGGHKNISESVINRIRSDRRFQANVRTLVTSGNMNINTILFNESEEIMDEEMDWEPTDQEVMIEHIKSIRKNLDSATTLSCDFVLHSNNFFKRLTDNVLLVLDTNIFISCLPFVKEMRDTYLPEIGLPSIFIPWIVLRELDHLKFSCVDQLARSAKRAIRYINETFSSNHPRVNGQSFEDFCSMKNVACDCSDDEILNICVNLKMCENKRKIILITNDKNLENKAMVSGIQAYSKQKFVENEMNTSNNSRSGTNSHNLITLKYTLYPKLKILMKIALEMVLESELKKAFDDKWLLIVFRKPPWSLIDVLECLLRHWRSVFTFTFNRELYTEIENIKKKFVAEDQVPGKGAKFTNMVKASEELLDSIRHQFNTKVSVFPEYLALVEHLTIALHEIELLKQAEKKLSQVQPPDMQTPVSSTDTPPSIPLSVDDDDDVPIAEPPVANNAQCKEEVKALLQIIWNQVQRFSFRITELVSNSAVADPEVVDQVKCQFPQVMNKLQQLVENIEKIISMEPHEIAQSSQLIIEFTNFLISLNIIQTDSLNVEALMKNIGFFCCDDESRNILSALICDLKHFGTQMVDGMKHLGLI